MKCKVTFRKRFNREGGEVDAPQNLVSAPDGVIEDAVFLERTEPPSVHVDERMEEDDDFLGFGAEVWVCDVADGREREFEHALVNSEVVLEFQPLEAGSGA